MTRDIRHIVACYKRKYKTSNPFELADMLHIEYLIGDIGSRSGCYMYLKRHKCILLSDKLTASELQFVMAHELGHAVLHPRENCYFIRHKTFLLNTRNEIEANKFAVELLISDEELREYQICKGFTVEQISRLMGYQKELIELRLK